MSSIEFQRSTVVITGVTRGLGRAMVDEFVRLGHMVLGCARTKTEIEDLSGEYPGQDFQVVNVASDAEVKAWAAHVSTKYGSPDFLLNNAAVINSKGPLWEIPDSVFSNV